MTSACGRLRQYVRFAFYRLESAWRRLPADELPSGARKVVYLDRQQVALFNVDGKVFALSNRCSHARGPLSEGEVECGDDNGCTVACPWHEARFDLATGRVVDGIANSPVRAFAVELRDGAIYVGPSLEPSLEPVEGGIR